MTQASQKTPQDAQGTRPMNVRGCIELDQDKGVYRGLCESGCRAKNSSYGMAGSKKAAPRRAATATVNILDHDFHVCADCFKSIKAFWKDFTDRYVEGDPQASLRARKKTQYQRAHKRATQAQKAKRLAQQYGRPEDYATLDDNS